MLDESHFAAKGCSAESFSDTTSLAFGSPATALSILAEQCVKISLVAVLHNEQSATVTSRKKYEKDSGSGSVLPHAHDKGKKIIDALRIYLVNAYFSPIMSR